MGKTWDEGRDWEEFLAWYDDMRLLAYEGGLGAVVVRRAGFVFVISGGKGGGFAGGVDDGIFVVGETGAEDGLFVIEGSGTGGDDTTAAMLLEKGLRLLFLRPAYLISSPSKKCGNRGSGDMMLSKVEM